MKRCTETVEKNPTEETPSHVGKTLTLQTGTRFALTDILQKDLNSRYVRCSASSMGSRWSKRRETFLFLLGLGIIFWLAFHDQSRSFLEGNNNTLTLAASL